MSSITGTSIVRYVGSQEHAHGDYILKGIDLPYTNMRKNIDGETAFELLPMPGASGHGLRNVKRTSFKVTGRHISPPRD